MRSNIISILMVARRNFCRGGSPKRAPHNDNKAPHMEKRYQKGPHVGKNTPPLPQGEKRCKKAPTWRTSSKKATKSLIFPTPHAGAQILSYLNIHIYFLKRKLSENEFQNAPNCTINKHSVEYAPIPLNLEHSNTILHKKLYF